ncbi:MAG: hypothetical protein ACRCXT_16270 [Paraclostridium sp.]
MGFNILDVIDVKPSPRKKRIEAAGVMKNTYENIINNNKYIKPNTVTIDLHNNPSINTRVLLDRLFAIDNIKDDDVFELISMNYSTILNTKFIETYGCANIFTNSKFLNILTHVLYKVNITLDIKICCNKIAYDYITLKNDNQLIKDMLINLSKTVNRDYMYSLVGLGIPDDIAAMILLYRYSSNKELVNLQRMNWVICNSPEELMDEQMIIYIYERLAVNSFADLFEATMFDIYEKGVHSESIMNIYSLTSLAITDILNNLPSDKIAYVLKRYTTDRSSILGLLPVRFSLQTLSYEDYYRIHDIIRYLANVEQIYVP